MTNQHGAMSFLTVIFLALLLSVMTLSFVRISVNEQRQAIDDDLSTRAFYAAESGIEDGKRAIAREMSNPDDYDLNGDGGVDTDDDDTLCDFAEGLNGELDVDNLDTSYTCQFIDLSPGEFKKTLAPWESVTIPLTGVAPSNQVRIAWHEVDEDGGFNTHNSHTLETFGAWQSGNFPAMLKTTVFAVADPSNFSRDSVSAFTGFLNPANSGGTVGVTTDGLDARVVNADCDPSNSPACVMTLNNLPGGQRYLHIQAFYRSTNVVVELVGTDLLDVQAKIDVTGRAGDVYRRVEARVSLVPESYPFPDVAVWSNEEICKNFTVTDDPVDFDNGDCVWAGDSPGP